MQTDQNQPDQKAGPASPDQNQARTDQNPKTPEPLYTPGRWRIVETAKAVAILGRSVDPFDGRPLMDRETEICTVGKGRWTYEQAANARLIAAGPELLEALKAARWYVEAWTPKVSGKLGQMKREKDLWLIDSAIANAEKRR